MRAAGLAVAALTVAANADADYDEKMAATAELDEDPYNACMEECAIGYPGEHEWCNETCTEVEENTEEDDVWECLYTNCEQQLNDCMEYDVCMNEASEEETRMDCVSGHFKGCTAEFQNAFACYMEYCFHPSHIPALHHDSEISVEELHESANSGHGGEHHHDEEMIHEGEYHDEEKNEVYEEEQEWEEEEYEHDVEDVATNELHHEHEEHHDDHDHHHHRCPVFDEAHGDACSPHECYDNGWCEVSCPHGFVENDGNCIQEECPAGQHIIMNWEVHPAEPFCADVREVDITEKIPFHETEGDCWQMGEGWEHRWLETDMEHGDWEEFCVKFAECDSNETRVWGIHGKQFCSSNYERESCNGLWSHVINEHGHHSRVCVEGARVDCGEHAHMLVNWESDGEPEAYCISARPVGIEEVEPVYLEEDPRGDDASMGCEQAPEDGICNHHIWYCNANCPYVDCWMKGEGWQDTWEHGRQSCVKYEQCRNAENGMKAEARVQTLRGHQLCTEDHAEPQCYGSWSWMFSEEKGHHIRVCIQGTPAEQAERSARFHHHDHKDEHHSGEEDVWGCLKDNCGEQLDNCFGDEVCAWVVQDDEAREECMANGFECSEFLYPLFECYMQSCDN